MVHIQYNRDTHSLRLHGHAGAEESGKNLVCAAVSALTLTLAYNVAQLVSQGNVSRPEIRLESGSSAIRCYSRGRSKPVVTLMFDTVCTGFALLQSLYPDMVDYRVY